MLLGPLLEAFNDEKKIQDESKNFMIYTFGMIKSLPSEDIQPSPAILMEGSYNPSKLGRAFYFRKDGKQILESRVFQKDREKIKRKIRKCVVKTAHK